MSRMPRTVLVLGASYAGSHAAEVLAKTLPTEWRVVLVDRQTHFNHLYLFPRLSVVPSHAQKAFIPYTHLLAQTHTPDSKLLCDSDSGTCSPGQRHLVVHAHVERIHKGYIEVDRPLTELEAGESHGRDAANVLRYDYLVYALGCKLPPPLVCTSRTKQEGVAFLTQQQTLIAKSKSILIIGGGALGIQYASDIADLYNNPENESLRVTGGVSNKKITLVHSRDRFLPLYKPEVHDAVLQRLEQLGVDVVMNHRPQLPSDVERASQECSGEMRTINIAGREIEYDLLLRCTGQLPNSALLESLCPDALDSHRYVKIKPTLQVDAGDVCGSDMERTFAIGDVAAAGVIKAGHTGWNQAEIAAANILASIEGREMIEYEKSPPQIKVTLGLRHSVSELLPDMKAKETVVSTSTEGPVEGYWKVVWNRMGVSDVGDAWA